MKELKKFIITAKAKEGHWCKDLFVVIESTSKSRSIIDSKITEEIGDNCRYYNKPKSEEFELNKIYKIK